MAVQGVYFELFPPTSKNNNINSQEALICICTAGKKYTKYGFLAAVVLHFARDRK